MTEKGELIVGETDMGWSPISLVPFDVRIVPSPESCVEIETIHVQASMPIGFQTP